MPPRAFLICLKSSRLALVQLATVGADLGVEGDLRRGPGELPAHLPKARDAVGGAVGGSLRVAEGGGEPTGHAADGLPQPGDRVADQSDLGRRAMRIPRPLLALELEVGLDIEEQDADVDGGDAVREGVVSLIEDGEAIIGEALHQTQLPEGAGAIQGRGEEAADQLAELDLGAGRRQGLAATWRRSRSRGSRPIEAGRGREAGRRGAGAGAAAGAGGF